MPRDGIARVTRWSSHRAFLVVAIGATIGLGNAWRFPQLVAEHGGSAFLVTYLGVLLLLGMPLLVAELVLSRRATGSLPETFRDAIRAAQAAPAWHALPWLVLAAAWSVLVVLLVSGSWLLAYFVAALQGDLAVTTLRESALKFDALAGAPAVGIGWMCLFFGSASAVSSAGIRRGVERAALAGLVLIVLCWGTALAQLLVDGRIGAGMAQVFGFDPASLGFGGLRAALVQAFYTLTLGAGVIYALGVHLPPGGSLPGLAVRIALADTLFALVAALLVLGSLAAAGLEPVSGPRLVFESLPLAFGRLHAGAWVLAPFYLGLVLIAWLSTLALLEPLVLWLAGWRGLGRVRAVLVVSGSLAAVGAGLLVAYAGSRGGRWAGYGPLGWLEYLGGHLLVPLAALLLAVFVGWLWPDAARRRRLPLVGEGVYRAWLSLLRYAVPLLLALLLVTVTGILPGRA